MGEIADAYIWAEMNGVDLDDNPDAWVEYYHDKECEEYEEELIGLKKKIKKLNRTNKKLKEENTKLKELLKRAKEVLEDEGDYMIVQEINQVLGDKING